jgi:hypothetical protein
MKTVVYIVQTVGFCTPRRTLMDSKKKKKKKKTFKAEGDKEGERRGFCRPTCDDARGFGTHDPVMLCLRVSVCDRGNCYGGKGRTDWSRLGWRRAAAAALMLWRSCMPRISAFSVARALNKSISSLSESSSLFAAEGTSRVVEMPALSGWWAGYWRRCMWTPVWGKKSSGIWRVRSRRGILIGSG